MKRFQTPTTRVRGVWLAFLTLGALAGASACSSNINGKGSTASTPATSSTSAGSASAGTSAGANPPGTSSAGATTFCAKLAATADKLADLSGDVSNPGAAAALINEEEAEFNSLKADAPADVAAAIGDLVKLLDELKGYLANPTAAPPAAITDLQTKLPADSQVIGTYIAKNCAGG